MSLSTYKVAAVIAVSDLDRAREFYEEKLGLSATDEEQPADSRRYVCGEDTSLDIYVSADNAGKAGGTVAGWDVDDVERVVDELASRGVTFEQYDEPIKTDEKGINTTGEFKAAWFRDPDGNTFAVVGR
jgi:catechol 2,3-dioxygenase-like lactoylglutathione lyase family enzyme